MRDRSLVQEIVQLKEQLDAVLVAHFYQRDEVVAIADITGDSLELARRAKESSHSLVVFAGVGFMGQSVKILAPHKRVIMPRIACCSMARMIDSSYFDASIAKLQSYGISKEAIFPLTYINSNAEVKAKVGEMGGLVCTSANASKIMKKAQESGKKIFFLPDRCLAQNLAKKSGQSSAILGVDAPEKIVAADVICYDGFCSVHQLFTPRDIDFYRNKFPDILIAVHPECDPSVVEKADFVGSTSQIIAYVKALPIEQKVAVGTEYNLVNRLREKNTFVLSSTKPECPTMNETTLEDVLACLKAFEQGEPINEIILEESIRVKAHLALSRMMELS